MIDSRDRFKYGLKIHWITIFLLLLAIITICLYGQQKKAGLKDQDTRSLFISHDRTNFPLIGQHRSVQCSECHLNQVYKGTPSSCEVCHWKRSQDDRYQLRLGIHCGDCHTPFSWKKVPPNKWNHEHETGYRLPGIHWILDCVNCHGENGFFEKTVDCFSCHEDDYESVQAPDHQAAPFPLNCKLCHLNENSWQDARFDHILFPLTGNHRNTKCTECHLEEIYFGLPSDCVSCHMPDFNIAKDPDHLQSGFPFQCDECHNTNSWKGAIFSHVKYPLQGKHRFVPCMDCHNSGIFEGLPHHCAYCHLEDYLNAENPNHKQLSFHTDCQYCHGTDAVSWTNTSFRHTSMRPLQGAHTQLDCIQCHKSGTNLLRNCSDCHKTDYDSTSNPDHKAAGYPPVCESCHLPSHRIWNQAVFAHRFPLKTTRHAHLDCVDCHTSGDYKMFSCINCHAHEKRRTDIKHLQVPGYAFNNLACLACHYQGRK